MENKAYQTQIRNLQVDISVEYSLGDKGTTTQRLLKDKEGTIQLLKKKLDILATRLIQNAKLIEIGKEKEALNTDIIDYRARLLKREEKEK